MESLNFELKSILEKCLELDPRRRPTSEELRDHPYFNKFIDGESNLIDFTRSERLVTNRIKPAPSNRNFLDFRPQKSKRSQKDDITISTTQEVQDKFYPQIANKKTHIDLNVRSEYDFQIDKSSQAPKKVPLPDNRPKLSVNSSGIKITNQQLSNVFRYTITNVTSDRSIYKEIRSTSRSILIFDTKSSMIIESRKTSNIYQTTTIGASSRKPSDSHTFVSKLYTNSINTSCSTVINASVNQQILLKKINLYSRRIPPIITPSAEYSTSLDRNLNKRPSNLVTLKKDHQPLGTSKSHLTVSF